MKPLHLLVLKRLAFGLPIDVLGMLLVYYLSKRWDFTLIAGVFLVAGHLNDTFGSYLVARKKLQSENDIRE